MQVDREHFQESHLDSQTLALDLSRQWQPVDGGDWSLEAEGVRVKGTGPEWIALRWLGWNAEQARPIGVEDTGSRVSGRGNITD